MAKSLRMLDQVHIAKPCPANWHEMAGDDRSRHCSQCQLNVYNLSDMSESEAQTFLSEATGRVCVRYYQRPDGKVMTKDCPRGLRAVRLRLASRVAMACSLLLTAIGCGEQGQKVKRAFGVDAFEPPPVVMGKVPVTMGAVAPPAPQKPAPGPSMIMGEIAPVDERLGRISPISNGS